MQKKKQKYRDSIFVITRERACPFYSIGEELKIENHSFTPPSYKPGCLYLAKKLMEIVSAKETFSSFPKMGVQKTQFDCGGCEGLIHFEYKKEKDYATLQMKMLIESEERRKRAHLDKFFGVLRKLEIFETLDDSSLSDLTLLLELKNYLVDKVVLKKGDPGSHLYIVLKGLVGIMGDDGSRIAELGPGSLFGEMSFLSGEPVPNNIHSIEATQVALLSIKNFKYVLQKYPVLQLFLLKMLVEAAQLMTLRAGDITSGMTGKLEEVPAVDLFQLINSSQKTGTVELATSKGSAVVYFSEGEIVHARYLQLKNKEAVFALLTVKNGHFSYARGVPEEFMSLEPIGGFMGMMMEGLQRIDEDE